MTIENDDDLRNLLRIGRICGEALQHMLAHVEPGMTTAQLDAIGAEFVQRQGARSAPILAYKFPGFTCISLNDEAAHGIPGERVIQAGDLDRLRPGVSEASGERALARSGGSVDQDDCS